MNALLQLLEYILSNFDDKPNVIISMLTHMVNDNGYISSDSNNRIKFIDYIKKSNIVSKDVIYDEINRLLNINMNNESIAILGYVSLPDNKIYGMLKAIAKDLTMVVNNKIIDFVVENSISEVNCYEFISFIKKFISN